MMKQTTLHFQRALQVATQVAINTSQNSANSEHILLSILSDCNVATALLEYLNVNLDQVRAGIMTQLRLEPEDIENAVLNLQYAGQQPLLSSISKQVLLLAYDEADRQGSYAVDEGHLLLGLIREKTAPASHMLTSSGVDLEQLRFTLKILHEGGEAFIQGDGTGQREKHNLDEILIALRHESLGVREQAIQHLQTYVNSTSSEIVSRTHIVSKTLDVWNMVHSQLLQDTTILEALLTAINDSSPQIRIAAIIMLKDLNMVVVQENIIRLLGSDPVCNVRKACVIALGQSYNSPRKLASLIEALQDSNDQVASQACFYLGKIGDQQAQAPLRALLSHSSWKVRYYSCEALVRLKAVDLSIVNLLEELNQQPEAQQHNQLRQSINEINTSFEMGAISTMTRVQTTQAILDEARSLLS